MPIATLTIDIEARLARLEEGLNQVVRVNQKAANDVQQHWASAGSAIQKTFAVIFTAETVRRIADFVDTNARAVERLRDIGFATGSTIENISALQDVARRAGKDIEVAETALIKLNKALNESKPGS